LERNLSSIQTCPPVWIKCIQHYLPDQPGQCLLVDQMATLSFWEQKWHYAFPVQPLLSKLSLVKMLFLSMNHRKLLTRVFWFSRETYVGNCLLISSASTSPLLWNCQRVSFSWKASTML
jgi:hypothetical protein